MQAYRTACTDAFPVEFVCDGWKNDSGQVLQRYKSAAGTTYIHR